MWDAVAGQWRDLILESPSAPYAVRHSSAVAASNWVPLFAGVADPGRPQALQAVQSLESSGLLQPGGLAATTVTTGALRERGLHLLLWRLPRVLLVAVVAVAAVAAAVVVMVQEG
jgi:neutral trehalase